MARRRGRTSRTGPICAVLSVAAAVVALSAQNVATGPEPFRMRLVAAGLGAPWQMRWAPDGSLWVTERVARRIVRMNPDDGRITVVTTIPEAIQRHAQDGVLGLAFHRDFLRRVGRDHVFVAFTYDADPGAGEVRRLKVRRYTYDAAIGTLGEPVDLIDNLPAGADHVAARLVFGRDDTLYLSLGDQGYNQLALYCSPILAQDLPTAEDVAARNWPPKYQGKILRLNLDGSIPADNPSFNGVRSHIYSYGHRNPQGLAQAADGALYESEHGPSMDDEVNRIRAGGNYGWPFVAGYKDDRVYAYADWSKSAPAPCASLKFDAIVAPPSVPQQQESAWNDPAFVPPLQTFFTVGPDYRFNEAGNATIAPSGVDVYDSERGIPGWRRSILVTSLIRGVVYRVKLDGRGESAAGEPLAYFKTDNRYRDVLVHPDGRTIFVATDSSSRAHPGAILAFTYDPRP
ncbi:MAG: PQQ-dependent sugar dehydrogenase [Acidobacteria bacterium]|nr:PQQ-dependent sugar dehydrogenase [Acidobacteriota bacterium]